MQIFEQRKMTKAAASAVARHHQQTTYRFSAVFAFDLPHHNGTECVCVRFNWKTERIQSEAPKRIDFYLIFFPQKYIFGTNEPCQCHKERRWRWSQSKQRTQGLRTRECNGDGWHRRDAQRKESRQWSRAHDADTPKWARVWQTKSWNK